MKNNNVKCAKIIKNLNSLSHLIKNIEFNYNIFCSAYYHRESYKDMEYKDVECALNNFILTASILKQHIKSFEKDIDITFIKTKKYQKVMSILFDNEQYLILLGLRNYLQHLFHIKICLGNSICENSDQEDLYITNYTLLKHQDLHLNKPENIALKNFFGKHIGLSIILFVLENMDLIDKFYKRYDKVIHEHYNSILSKYNKEKDVDQYALDLGCIYRENISSFIN